MKQINNLIVVEVPEDAYNFRFCIDGTLFYDTTSKKHNSLFNIIKYFDHVKCKILGKLSELSEDVCSRFVENLNFLETGISNAEQLYKCYFETVGYPIITAKESLTSLLQSNGVDCSNLSKILLIEKL